MQIREWEVYAVQMLNRHNKVVSVPIDPVKPDTRVLWEERAERSFQPNDVFEGKVIGNEDLLRLKRRGIDYYFLYFNDEKWVSVTTAWHLKIPPPKTIQRINIQKLVF